MEDELLRTDDEHGNDGENNDLHQREAGPQPQRPMGGWENAADDLGDNDGPVPGGNNNAEGWGNDADDLGDNEAPGPDDLGDNEAPGLDEDNAGPASGGNNAGPASGGNNAGPALGGNNAGPASGGNNTAPAPGTGALPIGSRQQVNDAVNVEMAEVMAENIDENRREQADPRRAGAAFDKLDDLITKKKRTRRGRKARQEDNANPEGDSQRQDNQETANQVQNDEGQADTPQGVKKTVDNLRGGQLYKAVVLARHLERGGQNPMADNKFKGFFNSSGFNSAADKIKLVGAANATAVQLDATFKKSYVSQVISLVSSLVGFVTTIKSLVQKIKSFKGTEGKFQRFIGITGILSDFAMAVSKGAAIAQSIAAFMGKFDGIVKKVIGYITVFANGASQIGGIITGVNGLKKAVNNRNKIKGMRDNRWEEVKKMLPRYMEPEDDGGPEDEEEENHDHDTAQAGQNAVAAQTEQNTPAAQAGGKKKRLSPKQARQLAKQRRATMKERRALANMLLRREDVSDEDKDKIVSYLAACRMVEKLKSAIGLGASGLVTNAIGLGTSIATGVFYAGDAKAETASKHMGIISGFAGTGVSAAKLGVDKVNQKKQNNEETKMMKERLWGHIHELDNDKYGLKGISESLEADPSPEKAAEAKGVVAKYNAVDAQLKGAFVNYGAVFKAKNAEEFRKLLVAGI